MIKIFTQYKKVELFTIIIDITDITKLLLKVI